MMRSLFSISGVQRLDRIVGPRLLCAFDFDGTLAPIVPTPDEAMLPEDIRRRLLELSVHAPVAIITGRSVQDIRGRLGFDPEYVVGNHGLEGVPGWDHMAAQHEHICIAWRSQLADPLREYGAGIQLEDKRYSLSVHYRQVKDPELAAHGLQRLFSTLSPAPRVVAGKYVFNLLAEDACHKGSALARLIDLCGASNTIYIGDDVTDEDVFRMRRSDVLSVRIEQANDSAADFFLPDTRDILPLLEDLVSRLRSQGVRNWVQAETENSA